MAEKQRNVPTDIESQGQQRSPAERQRGVSPFAQLERDMQRMFEGLLGRGWLRPWQWETPDLPLAVTGMPKIDVVERDSEVFVRAELPGVEKDDLDVSLGEGTVTIKATAHKEAQQEDGDYFRREIACGEVSRTVALPCDVDGDNAQATFTNGVLELTLPKTERARRRQINVQ
jgi:HSP20 family protein